MDKKHKRLAKKNAKKLNRPANPKPTEIKQIPEPTRVEPAKPQPKTEKPPEEIASGHDKKDGKKSFSWKVIGFIATTIIVLLGFIGYEALWPQVIIEPSQAVDSGILSYEFSFENRACYPIKIDKVDLYVIKMSWPHLSWAFSSRNWPSEIGSMQGIGFRYDYKQVNIGGRNSITMQLNPEFEFRGYPVGKLKDGSKMAIKITYRLPLLRTEKTDCQFFESGQDGGGNPVWLKKPMENLGSDTNYSIMYYKGTNEVY